MLSNIYLLNSNHCEFLVGVDKGVLVNSADDLAGLSLLVEVGGGSEGCTERHDSKSNI